MHAIGFEQKILSFNFLCYDLFLFGWTSHQESCLSRPFPRSCLLLNQEEIICSPIVLPWCVLFWSLSNQPQRRKHMDVKIEADAVLLVFLDTDKYIVLVWNAPKKKGVWYRYERFITLRFWSSIRWSACGLVSWINEINNDIWPIGSTKDGGIPLFGSIREFTG